MKETIYKSLSFSFLITNVWTIAAFFVYFYEKPGLFHGWGTLIFYIWSCWIIAFAGIIIILSSFLKRYLTTAFRIFSLIVITSLNSFCLILFVLLSVQGLIRFESFIDTFLIMNLIIPIVALLVIRKIRNPNKI
jgi:hypothetical protein